MIDIGFSADVEDFGSGDDTEQPPDSYIEALRSADPEFARRSFHTLSTRHRCNITALSMADSLQHDLRYGRKPSVTPLLKADRIEGTSRFIIDTLSTSETTGFNRTFLEALGIHDIENNPEQQLQNLVDAYIGGFVVNLELVTSFSNLTHQERAFEVVPFPGIRLTFDAIEY